MTAMSNYNYVTNSLANIKNPLFNMTYGIKIIQDSIVEFNINFIFIYLFINNSEDVDSISVDVFELYVQKMHVDGDFGFVQLYEVSSMN